MENRSQRSLRGGAAGSRARKPETINQLCDLYQAYADDYYQQPTKDGTREPTGHAVNMKQAMRAMRAVAGDVHPDDLMAEDLLAAQEWMIDQGLSVDVINTRINRIRQVIHWAGKIGRRWVSSAVIAEMGLIEPLKPGRCKAPHYPDVQPVAHELVTSTMAAIPPVIRHLYVMIDLHWLTGMRPGELCHMERDELSIERPRLATGESVEIMVYRPAVHKTRHHGFDRNIFLGPEARRIVEDRLRVCKGNQLWPYKFSSAVNSYRQAIVRVNKTNGLEHWHPNQIRHSFGTRMRSTSGIDVAQVLMGHRHRSTTEIYAQPDCSQAIQAIMRHC